jgi:hypothetical protein
VIDLDVLYVPSHEERQKLNRLSQDLKKNVVVYNGHVSRGAHLCRVLQAATLTPAQLEALGVVEKIFKEGQVVVAYENPLTFASDQDLKSSIKIVSLKNKSDI